MPKLESQERLKAFFNPNHTSDQLARLKKLPSNLSTIGQILIQAGPVWEKLQEERNSRTWRRWDAGNTVASLSTQERQLLFTALFPGIAAYVEDTWNLFDLLPYQYGYQRRPFRNPHQKNMEARISWLQSFPHAVRGYEHQGIQWLAAWAAHLGYWGPNALGYLFASTIAKKDQTGDEVFNILLASANGTHEIGTMGRHVVRALLCSPRADGWEYIEKLLLAAQREEGLRQVVLEALDEAHPDAFRRILGVVIDQNLIRFSSAMRAFSVWFGLPFETATPKTTRTVLEQVQHFLNSGSECEMAARDADAEQAYYALWSLAFDDITRALPHAIKLAESSNVEKRFIAVHMLGQLNVSEGLAALLSRLDDDDLRISAHALFGIAARGFDPKQIADSDLFERLERLLPRVKHKQNNLKPLVWDWLPISLNRELVTGQLIDCLGTRSPKRLSQYLPMMNPSDRARVARVLLEKKTKDRETLQTLLQLVSDLSPHVRETAIKGLHGIKLQDGDILYLEGPLSRQSQDLRRSIIQLLLELPDKALIESIHRLMRHKGDNQRLAALEILKVSKESQRLMNHVVPLAQDFKQSRNPSSSETILLDEILSQSAEKYTLEDALGLLDPAKRTKPKPIKTKLLSKVKLGSTAALATLKSLDALVEEHRNDSVEVSRGNATTLELLGNLQWGWTYYPVHRPGTPNFENFPLKEAAEAWWQSRSKDLLDADGHELIRAYAALQLFPHSHRLFSSSTKGVPKELQQFYGIDIDLSLQYQGMIDSILEWLIWKHPSDGEVDFILSAVSKAVGKIPYSELVEMKPMHQGGVKIRTINRSKLNYLGIARWLRAIRPESWTSQHHAALWNIVCWLNEPEPGLPGNYADLDDLLLAYEAGAATRDDLFYMLLGPRHHEGYGMHFHLLSQFSGQHRHDRVEPLYAKFPVFGEIVNECRERILDVECKRGELPTAATAPAGSIRSVPGMRNLFRLLVGLGEAGFERGYHYYSHGQNRSGVLSHLIRNTYPTESDTPESFTEQASAHNISEKRLLELAVYAPQWSHFVEHAIGWEHLTDAVWWLYAHTKDRQWTVEQAIREEWAARISEHTPLTADNLMDGAVDVAWFRRVYAEMGEQRWKQLYDAALYTSHGIGHGRARLFADAMLGKTTVEKETDRIRKKRNQDSVRALGLIAIGDDEKQKEEVLKRYEVMQEFLRTGKKFGSQRKASERLAVSIGMQNLARTAGYSDPQRLEWAMEVEAVADLNQGPIRLELDGYTVTLSINDLGEPVLEFRKKDKLVKTLPSAIKKNERVAAILERKQQLDRQVSRMRLSLEQSMCRGDEFNVSEINTLFRHPMLKAMIEQLVFVSGFGLGYPVHAGASLCDHQGRHIILKHTDLVRIAHPLDLLESKEWHLWQHECFIAERIQPFKQIFRELYVLTSNESDEGNLSRRYAGQQLNPRQALALFGQRGWITDPNEGVQKTFHQEGISARVGFLNGAFTPAEVEGLTLEAIAFTRRGDWNALKLESIPPRIFSEVMRDLDLVVSVAHADGVDPESTTSSIESRTALIRETVNLLNLGNVQISAKHAVIDGKLANYNVNLGSGVVHKQPGGAICIIPVHSQHRGRIFLPFADNDPKTAEIVSKVVLLARDDEIKDPTILEQIL